MQLCIYFATGNKFIRTHTTVALILSIYEHIYSEH